MINRPLEVSVEGDELVIRIGLETLKFCAEHCEGLVEYPGELHPPFVKVVDMNVLAADAIRELEKEEEDGTTPLHLLLDECFVSAMEDGSEAFDYNYSPKKV